MLPLAAVVTPNLHEAAALADMPVATEADMEEAARRIHRAGPAPRAGQGRPPQGSADRHPLRRARLHALSRRRGSTRTTRTAPAARCRRRSPPASRTAAPLADAIGEAKAYVTAAIREGFPAGRGVGVLRHFVGRLVAMARTVDDKMPFMEHLGELRVRIMRALIAAPGRAP